MVALSPYISLSWRVIDKGFVVSLKRPVEWSTDCNCLLLVPYWLAWWDTLKSEEF